MTERAIGSESREGRLLAHPHSPTRPGSTGLHRPRLAGQQDALVWVPGSYDRAAPAPLIVLLHGAGGNAQGGLRLVGTLADEYGVILVAPASRGQSWDLLHAGWGPDVETVDRALAFAFDHYAIDRTRLAIGGFSDGASYALSLGITNGALFSHLLAFSPGFVAPAAHRGRPKIFISHGTGDTVLRIGSCSRRIVPALERMGYAVAYREFDGAHTVPAGVVREALTWLGARGTRDQAA